MLDADIAALREAGATYLPTAERAVRALARISAAAARDFAAEPLNAEPVADLAQLGSTIPEYRSKEIMGARGIAFPAFALAQTLEEAVLAADRLGYPVVLKAQSPELPPNLLSQVPGRTCTPRVTGVAALPAPSDTE